MLQDNRHVHFAFSAIINSYFIAISLIALGVLYEKGFQNVLNVRTTNLISDPHAYDIIFYSIFYFALYKKFGVKALVPFVFFAELGEMQWDMFGFYWTYTHWIWQDFYLAYFGLSLFLVALFFMHWTGFRLRFLYFPIVLLIIVSVMMMIYSVTYPQGIFLEFIWQIIYLIACYPLVVFNGNKKEIKEIRN